MQRVVERILNLLAFLLTVGRPVTADEIRHTVAGYEQESDEAFRRAFERDKDLLRGLGVPLNLESLDVWEVEQGYVVPTDEYALPDPGLTDEERAALWLAAQMVRLGGQAPDPAAMFKLGGAPLTAGGEPLTADLGAAADELADLFAAVTERRRIRLTYHDTERVVHPYGLVHRRGHWYLVGLQEATGIRAFRVDRMAEIVIGDLPGAFEKPEGVRAADALAEVPWEAGGDEIEVVIRFDQDVAWWARRQLTNRSVVDDAPGGGVTARVPVANVDSLIGWLIGFDDHAEILSPAAVRSKLVEHIRGAG